MISVICCTIRDDMMENVFQNYEKQDMQNKELIIILNRNEMDLRKWKNRAKRSKHVSVYQRSTETALGECLNDAIQFSQYDIIAKMDDDDYYAPPYLSQQDMALKKNKADVVCKRTVYMYFEQEKTLAIHFADKGVNLFLEKEWGVKGATLVFRKSICPKIQFPPSNRGEDMDFLKNCLTNNNKIYVTDNKNYVCLRRSESLHTWKVPNLKLLKESKFICKTEDYRGAI